jgi:hypothetical protein
MSKNVPEYIRVAGVLYKKAPASPVRTALDTNSVFTPVQDSQAKISKQLTVISDQLSNMVRGLMNHDPNQASAATQSVGVLQQALDSVSKELAGDFVQKLNTYAAQLAMPIPGQQVQPPTAPAPSGVAAPPPAAPTAPAAPAPAQAPASAPA